VKNLDRVPDKERDLILAWKLHLDGKDEEALARYEAILSRYPEEKQVLYLAGDLLHHRDDLRRALGFFERALALDPTFEWALDHVVNDSAPSGDARRWRVRRWARPPAPRSCTIVRATSGGDAPAAGVRREGARPAARRRQRRTWPALS
jgi:tetratricopeptide (TPR) repeat protein